MRCIKKAHNMRIIHICLYTYMYTREYFSEQMYRKRLRWKEKHKRKRNKKKRKNEKSIKRCKKKKKARSCILLSDLHCMRILAQPISYPFLMVYILHPSYWMTFLLLASPEEWTDNTLRNHIIRKKWTRNTIILIQINRRLDKARPVDSLPTRNGNILGKGSVSLLL